MIRLEQVGKRFKNREKESWAVRNVNLEIHDGEIFGIIGSSGAGKSTLVRCINLLERPTEGKVFVGGKELTSLSGGELRKERKKIGMIFQQFNLFSNRTVFQNVVFPLRGSGLTGRQAEAKAEELLKLVGLTEKADAYPSKLSGGQKQRVAIARALASDPQILLSDESTSALDPQTTKSILELLKRVNEPESKDHAGICGRRVEPFPHSRMDRPKQPADAFGPWGSHPEVFLPGAECVGGPCLPAVQKISTRYQYYFWKY